MGFLYVCEGVVLAYLTGFVLRSGLCLDIVSVQLPSTGSGFTDRISSFLHFLLETAEVEPLELLKNCVHAGLDVLSVCLAYMGLLAHFTQIYHLYNLLIYNILRRNLQLFITEFCIFSPCIIFISNKNSDKSIEILHISPKYITSVDNLMIHIFSSTFNFLYSFTPSDRLESKS